MKQVADADGNSPGFNVPWGALSIGLAAIAVASLGTLIVIASVQDVDALSTVALALAVLAFAAQLIVSLAQASAGAQQIAQAERINAATQSALADLRATSRSQLENQKEIFAQVLRAALPSVAQEISEDAVAAEGASSELHVADIEARLESSISRVLADYVTSIERHVSPSTSPEEALSTRMGRLTVREREVGELLTAGMTSSQIARRLGISTSTVALHRANIARKLGVANSVEIAQVFADSQDDAGGASQPPKSNAVKHITP